MILEWDSFLVGGTTSHIGHTNTFSMIYHEQNNELVIRRRGGLVVVREFCTDFPSARRLAQHIEDELGGRDV